MSGVCRAPQAEKARSDALLQRMSNLIACFPFKAKEKLSNPGVASGVSIKANMSLARGSSNLLPGSEDDLSWDHLEVSSA